MKQTEHYDLNQWELSDRVRMEDFNADNLKLESALSGLEAKIGGLSSSQDLDSVREQLEAADASLKKTKLGSAAYSDLKGEAGFHISEDRTHWEMDLTQYPGLTSAASFSLDVFIPFGGLKKYYLTYNAMYEDDCVCVSTDGVFTNALAVLHGAGSTCVTFIPHSSSMSQILTVFAGPRVAGVGSGSSRFLMLRKLILTPSDMGNDADSTITANIRVIKSGLPA